MKLKFNKSLLIYKPSQFSFTCPSWATEKSQRPRILS